MTVIDQILTLLLFQLQDFGAAKDWVLITLVGLVGALIGGAWLDVRAKIAVLDAKLEAKINQDAIGYQRLARVETETSAIWRAMGNRHTDREGVDG